MASFISVLKGIGEAIVNAAGIVTGVGPLLTGIIPAGSKAATVETTVTSDLSQIANIVTLVESAFTAVSSAKTGTLKLQAAAPLVSQVIQNSSILAGHKISNPTLFNQGVVDVTNGVVEILNSIEAHNIGVTGNGTQPVNSTGAVPPPAATVPVVTPPPTTS